MTILKMLMLASMLLLALPARRVSAADSPPTIHPGEIAVSGLIETADGTSAMTLGAAWVSTPDGKVTRLQPVRSKRILADVPKGSDGIVVTIVDAPDASRAWAVGMLATAIGPDSGPGKPLSARRVLVWRTGSLAPDGRTVEAAAGSAPQQWDTLTGLPLPTPPALESAVAPAPVAPIETGSSESHPTLADVKPAIASPASQPLTSTPLDHPYDYDYSAVDAWAAAAPTDVENSIPALAAYLARGAKNQRELARSIFDWTATHIAYDYDGIAARACDPAPNHVLASQVAECVGNSQLFVALAKAVGLNAVSILGVSRTAWWDPVFEIAPGHTFPTHAWNAVQIDGQWRLLDVTNDQTLKKQNGTLQKQRDFNPEWFLLPADQFLYTHVPNDPTWQLQTTPLTAAAADVLPYLRPSFFRYGLQFVGENHASLRSDDHLDLTIAGPANCSLLAELLPLGKDPLSAGYTLTERDGGRFHIRVVFPAPGLYQLRVYAHPIGDRVFRDVVAEWRVDAAGGSDAVQVPTICGQFSDAGCCLYTPLTRTLQAGAPQTFRIRVPGALHVGIITGGQILPLKAQGDVYSGTVIPAPGELQIGAEFPAQPGAYAGLVIYEVR